MSVSEINDTLSENLGNKFNVIVITISHYVIHVGISIILMV